MKPRLSFGGLFILLFLGSMLPLLALTGLLVFRLQRAYLLTAAQQRLIDFVRAGVEQYSGGPELTGLAQNLAGDMQVLGAELFIEDRQGAPVQPAVGPHSWLAAWEHQAARDTLRSKMQIIGSGAASRLVYLTPVVDATGAVLGSIEASLPVAAVTAPLNSLRRQITLLVVIAAGLAVVIAVVLARVITRPIQRMQAAMQSFSDGDLQARAPLSGPLEMVRLAAEYNRTLDWMAEDVRDQLRSVEIIPNDVTH